MKEQLQAFLHKYEQDIRTEAAALRNEPMPPLTEELFSLFETTGNRLRYENVYFLRRKYLLVFAMAAILRHQKEDILKLEEVIQDICHETCWALPAHVNRKEDRNWKRTIDLFASETAQSLAEIINILQTDLSAETKALVKTQVYERVLNPFYRSQIPYADWERETTNWCAVCAGSIGSATLYLLQEDKEKLEHCMNRITEALTWYMKGFTPDGACMEGLGYYMYGMTYFTGFAEQLYRHTKGRVNLFAPEKCSEIAAFQQKCYFPGGVSLSFSDGSSREKFRLGLTCYLASHFKETGIPELSLAAGVLEDSCARWMGAYRDYIWTKKYLEDLKEYEETDSIKMRCEVLPDAQWAIFKSPGGAVLAAKGGNNGEPHNHNDVGSFLFVKEGCVFLEDLGAGEYTKEYFGEGRYKILCNSSLGHNLPVINNGLQKAGKQYACDSFKADETGVVTISYGRAYGDEYLEFALRKIRFDCIEGTAGIEDTFIGKQGHLTVTENLITRCEPLAVKNQVILHGKGASALISLPEDSGEIRCLPELHVDHEGKEQKVWLIQWEVPVKDGRGHTIFKIT